MSDSITALAETIAEISGVDARKCMKCGKCSAACPSFSAIDIPPHRFVKMVEEGQIEALFSSDLLWKCLSCFACIERCPRGVEPAKLVEAVRLTVIRAKGQNYKNANDIPLPVELDEEIPQQLITSALRKYSK